LKTGKTGKALKKCKNCRAMQPVDYKIGDDIVLQPDLLVVCKPINKPYLDFAPALVAEILSPATALKDRQTAGVLKTARQATS